MTSENRETALHVVLERQAARMVPVNADLWPEIAAQARSRQRASILHRRMNWAAGLTATSAIVAVIVAVIAISPWEDGGGQTQPPSSGIVIEPGESAASCVERYGPDTLPNRDFAFEGTVKDIEVRADPNLPAGFQDLYWVTFTVNQWFKGGAGDEVGIWMEGPYSTAVEQGARLLVTGEPRWGGEPLDDAYAWSCGFTQAHNAEQEQVWAEAFRP